MVRQFDNAVVCNSLCDECCNCGAVKTNLMSVLAGEYDTMPAEEWKGKGKIGEAGELVENCGVKLTMAEYKYF